MLFRAPLFILAALAMILPASGQTFTLQSEIFSPPYRADASISVVSVADYNGDGRLDYYHPGSLYRQNADGTFSEVLEAAGIDSEGEGPMGGLFGDANNDGLLDLLIFDNQPGSKFYLNRTGGKFDLANIATNIQLLRQSAGAFWRDLNQDGWPDLAITYSDGNHSLLTGFSNGRYFEQGPFLRFQSNSPTCNLSPADYDNDGDVDVFSASCIARDVLLNQSGGFRIRYTDRASIAGVDGGRNASEGIWFDYDNDGWLDLLVINKNADLITSENYLYHNDGAGRFENVAVTAGIAVTRPLDSGPVTVADFDNDGWIDIYAPQSSQGKLYHNNGDGTFSNIFRDAIGSLAVPPVVGSGDFNNDGWVDLLLPGTGLLLNDGGSNNWVTIEVKDDLRNRFGVGATLRLTTGAGTQMRVIEAGSGGLGHSDQMTAHFGLGDETEIIQLEIQWPMGETEIFTDLPVNEHHLFIRGLGKNTPPSSFRQSMPPVAGFIDPDAQMIRFEWEPSLDDEPIVYRLFISGPGVQLTIPDIVDPFFELSTDLLPVNQAYEWSLTATDGHSVRYSGEERIFTFGQAGAAVSTFRDPIQYNFGLPQVSNAIVRFEDTDGDGDLDLLIGGDTEISAVLLIYRNVDLSIPLPGGAGDFIFKSFEVTETNLRALHFPRASFGDFDGDGKPDLVTSGISALNAMPETSFYLNLGSDFALFPMQGITPVWGGALEWGDFDGDGDNDLLIAGARNLEPPYEPITRIYENLGGSRLVDSGIELPGIMFGDVSWADIDGDGDLDIAITGDLGYGNLHSGIYRNDGTSFTLLGSELPELTNGSVAWADYDLDGDQDLFLTGGMLSPELLQGHSGLYINEGLNFIKHPFLFDGVLTGEAIWGDYENDGDPDLFIVGSSKALGPAVGRLFRNENGQFAAELDVDGVRNSVVAFGDYNGDGDMDFITIGINDNDEIRVMFFINQQIPELVPGQ